MRRAICFTAGLAMTSLIASQLPAQAPQPGAPATGQIQSAPGQTGKAKDGPSQVGQGQAGQGQAGQTQAGQGQAGQAPRAQTQPGVRQAPNAQAPNAQAPGQPSGIQARTALKPTEGMATKADRQIATCLAMGNEAEVTMANYAMQHAKHKDVQEFAQMMIEDHTKMLHQLRQYEAGSADASQPGAVSAQASAAQSAGNQTGAAGEGGGLNFMEVKKQITQRCIASGQKELGKKQGPEFDKCYVGMQIGKHMEMLDTVKVLTQYASPELRKTLEQGADTTQQHLDHAKHLMEKLEGAQASSKN